MSEDRRFLGILARLGAALCLAVMFTLVKIVETRGVGLLESLFYRQILAIPLVLGWLILGPGLRSVRTRRPIAHIWRTVLGLGGMVLNFATFLLLPLAEATTILFSVPLFATILSALVLREPTGLHRWGAVVLGLAGVILVAQPGSHPISSTGVIVGLVAAVVVAGVSITLRQIGRTESASTTVFWFTILSSLALGLLMPFVGEAHDLRTFALLSALGLAGGLAQILLTASLKLAPVSIVLPMDYSSLIWSTLLGWFVFGDLPAPMLWAGAPLIMASGLYIVYREHRLHRERAAAAVAIE